MVNRAVVKKALKISLDSDNDPSCFSPTPVDDQSSVTSLLIHDIFGGEILKTHRKKGWHFYNRIDGERVDFSRSARRKSSEKIILDDIPATPEENFNYFEEVEYSVLLTKFLINFEQFVGLKTA